MSIHPDKDQLKNGRRLNETERDGCAQQEAVQRDGL
jgi:hypothetical protein